jgi:hypothetical protein
LLQHVTIGKNTTFFTLPNGTQYSASSCVLIEEGRATKDNDPGFCAKTGEVQMQFDRHGELSTLLLAMVYYPACLPFEMMQSTSGMSKWRSGSFQK